MIIGVDFDNTIVNYDTIFYKVAREKGWIPEDIKKDKLSVRTYLRSIDKDHLFSELQGLVYGPKICEASPYPGVIDFFKTCMKKKIEVYIISHKTRQPIVGEKYDLHKHAGKWLEEKILSKLGVNRIPKEHIFFEISKEDKINRIKKTGCTVFIDDLPEFLNMDSFPDISKFLFDPQSNHLNEHIERVSSWSVLTNKIFEISEYMGHVKQLLSGVMDESFVKNMRSVEYLKGGRNNRVYLLETSNKEKLIVKEYFVNPGDDRNRVGAEKAFLEFAGDASITCVPELIACDTNKNVIVYKYIRGRKVVETDIRQELIRDAVDFFLLLNKKKSIKKARDLPDASESCFSLAEHLDTIKRRIDKLKFIDAESKEGKSALTFVNDKLRPLWLKTESNIQQALSQKDILTDLRISDEEKCISPSDFGFHNAIINSSNDVFFIDFEYAGWDDPAKLICDFFCQPDVEVPMKYLDYFLTESSVSEDCKERVKLLLPAYRVKWCCIMLNEFMPHDSKRRQFAKFGCEFSMFKQKQLLKLDQYFKNTKDIIGC